MVLHAASEALEGMEETIQQRKTRVHTAAVGSTGGVFLVLYLCSTAAWLVVFVVHTSRTPSSSKHVTVIPCLFGTRQACLSTDSDFLPLNNLLLHGKKKKKIITGIYFQIKTRCFCICFSQESAAVQACRVLLTC